MSDKKSKQSKEKKTARKLKKLKEQRLEKKVTRPQPDPNRTNAKLVHINNATNFMLQQHGNLEKRVQENIQQVWGNQEELKRGMDAAEFNLRAHQKVLNAFAIEFDRLIDHLNEEVFKTEHSLTVLELADITLGSDAGEGTKVVRRLNWNYYHEQVDRDLKVIKESEEKRLAEEKMAALELEGQMRQLTEASAELVEAAKAAGNDPVEVQAEYARLMEQTQRVSIALGQKLRGEQYDQSVLDEAQSLIDSMACLDDISATNEEALSPPHNNIPAGASVFGG